MNKTYIKLTLIAAVATILTGCTSVHEKYKETGWWTPDSASYTISTDTKMKPSEHYFGVGWSLK